MQCLLDATTKRTPKTCYGIVTNSALQSRKWQQELMVLQRIMQLIIARANENLDPRCSIQT